MKLLDGLPALTRNILLAALVLGGFAMISTALLAITDYATHDAIVESERQSMLKNLSEILPARSYDNDLLADSIEVTDPLLGSNNPVTVYRARLNGSNAAVIIAAEAPNGYNGRIKLLIGIHEDGSIAGVRVTSHRETPGLGDDVDLAKSDWVIDFNQKSLNNPEPAAWKVKKDGGVFDQFTGATITPRAVVKSVFNTLTYFHANKANLFTLPAASISG